MNDRTVTIQLRTVDKTRAATVTVPCTMRAGDLMKSSRKKWFLSLGVQYQIVNLNTNRQLSPYDQLTSDVVTNGDTLMLQPLATHGRD